MSCLKVRLFYKGGVHGSEGSIIMANYTETINWHYYNNHNKSSEKLVFDVKTLATFIQVKVLMLLKQYLILLVAKPLISSCNFVSVNMNDTIVRKKQCIEILNIRKNLRCFLVANIKDFFRILLIWQSTIMLDAKRKSLHLI